MSFPTEGPWLELRDRSNAKSLFHPVIWRSKRIPSRILLAPINTGYTTRSRPSYRLLRFHRERSGPTIGISMLGNVAVELSARANDCTAVLLSDRDIPRFAVIARCISQRGSLAGIQLASAPGNLFPTRRWLASSKLAEAIRLRDILSSYMDEELDHQLARFVRSALLAKEAGYDVIQVHAAHGYLLSLLLHPQTNTRLGRFSLHAPWFEEFLGQMNDVLGDSLLSIRLSTLTGLAPEDEEIEWTRSIEDRAAKSGVDILDLSAGFYTIDRQLIYPGRRWMMPVYSRWLKTLTRDLPCLVTIAGRFTDLRAVDEELSGNILVALGRALIADPDFAVKSRDGRYDEINFCQVKNHCHYFSRGRNALECGVNPAL